jgi:regulator of protease activity HflC (stomatin/prohibitin superfamily)
MRSWTAGNGKNADGALVNSSPLLGGTDPSIEWLIRTHEAPRLPYQVDQGYRAVVLRHGIPQKLLKPGRYVTLHGLPFTRGLKIVYFNTRTVTHRARVDGVLLEGGRTVGIDITAAVRLDIVDDDELMEWVEEYALGGDRQAISLNAEFELRVRRLAASFDGDQLHRHRSDLTRLTDSRMPFTGRGLVDIVRVIAASIRGEVDQPS